MEQASLARCHVSPSPPETASHRVCSNFSAFLCAPELRCVRRPPKDGSSESSVAVPNHRPERSSTGHLEPAGTRQETAEAPQPRTSQSSRHVSTEREELLFFTSLQATSYTPKPLHIPLPMFRPSWRSRGGEQPRVTSLPTRARLMHASRSAMHRSTPARRLPMPWTSALVRHQTLASARRTAPCSLGLAEAISSG